MEIIAAIALTFFFLLPGLVAILFWRQNRKIKQQNSTKQ